MILDERTEFADAVSVAAAASTALIGDVIDLGTDGVNQVDDLYVVIQTSTEIITGGSAGTIQFFLVSDSLATLGAAVVSACTTHYASPILITDDAAANSTQLNAGEYITVIQVPRGVYERYLGILCTVGTTTVTAGAINAFLTPIPPSWKAYDAPYQL
jgi:hypothetical protein